MYRLLAGIAALGLMAGDALADGPAAASAENRWTAFYIGLNGSWNFLDTDVSRPAQTVGSTTFDAADFGSQSGNGIGGGLQLGFDYQLDRIVLGMQAITSVTGFDSSHTTHGNEIGTELTSYGSLNARVGYLIQPEILAYGKGGIAFGSFKYSDKNATLGYSGEQSGERHQGWMVGGGIEYLFAPNWSVFAEYDYTDFGKQSVQLDYKNAGWGKSLKYDVEQNIGSAVLGVNYRF